MPWKHTLWNQTQWKCMLIINCTIFLQVIFTKSVQKSTEVNSLCLTCFRHITSGCDVMYDVDVLLILMWNVLIRAFIKKLLRNYECFPVWSIYLGRPPRYGILTAAKYICWSFLKICQRTMPFTTDYRVADSLPLPR